MKAICKMTGNPTTWPCSAAGCPLFGDCLTAYQLNSRKERPLLTNEECLKAFPKEELATTIHAFHLGYAPWCDHHCKNEGDDGCDQCILKWLGLPATENGELSFASVAPDAFKHTVRKHLSEVKCGDVIICNGRRYSALCNAYRDTLHIKKEYHVEVICVDDNDKTYLYESFFLDGMAVIAVGEAEAMNEGSKMEIRLTQNAYPSGTFCRLPTEDGKPSIYAMQGNWYQASAVDDDGNEYTVFWNTLDNWNGEDEEDACDWDHPTAVVQDNPWRDVTAKVSKIVFELEAV